MKKTYLGDRPDGSPRFDFDFSEDAAGLESGELAIFASGPASGVFTMEDGTTYGLSDIYTVIQGKHLAELHTAVHRKHHAEGRFLESPVPEDEYASFQADHFAAAEDRNAGLVTVTTVGRLSASASASGIDELLAEQSK